MDREELADVIRQLGGESLRPNAPNMLAKLWDDLEGVPDRIAAETITLRLMDPGLEPFRHPTAAPPAARPDPEAASKAFAAQYLADRERSRFGWTIPSAPQAQEPEGPSESPERKAAHDAFAAEFIARRAARLAKPKWEV